MEDKKIDPVEEEVGFLKKIWSKTIFPEMIKNYREEKRLRRSIRLEARKEALEELKPALKEEYKKRELDKLTGKKKGSGILDKLAKEFDIGDPGKKLQNMIGVGQDNSRDNRESNNMMDSRRIQAMFGGADREEEYNKNYDDRKQKRKYKKVKKKHRKR